MRAEASGQPIPADIRCRKQRLEEIVPVSASHDHGRIGIEMTARRGEGSMGPSGSHAVQNNDARPKAEILNPALEAPSWKEITAQAGAGSRQVQQGTRQGHAVCSECSWFKRTKC